MSSPAVQRLQRDLQEVLQNPLPCVVALPLEEDILQWHLNVRPHHDSCVGDASFHLILLFSEDYPKTEPLIKLLSPLPHPNVTRRLDGSWELSLWDCIPGFEGWTSAYSVQSVLLQLQTFLLDEDLRYDVTKVTMEKALQLARSAKCRTCPHDAASGQLFPEFHSSTYLKLCLQQRKKMQVSQPHIRPLSRPMTNFGKPAKTESSSNLLVNKNIDANLLSYQVLDGKGHSVPEKVGWQQVQGRRAIKNRMIAVDQHNLDSSDMQAHITQNYDIWKQVQLGNQTMQQGSSKVGQNYDNVISKRADGFETHDAGKVNIESSVNQHLSEDEVSVHNQPLAKNLQTKAAKKNRARSQKRAKSRELSALNAQGKNTLKNHTLEKNEDPVKAEDNNKLAKGLKDEIEESTSFDRASNSMGFFGLLPSEALTIILCHLSVKDLSFLSMTCQGIKEACDDGALWRELMHLHFPTTVLTAATLEDWKHAYALQQSNILGSLQCFYTRRTFKEDVLGFPISFTKNPRTKTIDYIDVSLDLLSETAYVKHEVRKTADNKKFDLLLPVYINQEHFDRAIPLLKKTAIALCPNWASRTFQAGMVLDFMPKLLNTMVVLLCDKGLAASERATDGYCMLHRLFLALCDHFQLWKEAERQVLKFKDIDQARRKEACPSLGITLLSVSSSQQSSWPELAQPWISETFDRAVIWACKSHPQLVNKYKVGPSNKKADEEMIQDTLQAHKISLRLAMFHAGFLRLIARPDGVPLEKVAATYDSLYGMPSLSLKKRFQSFVTKVINNHSWPYFFQVVGLQCPTKEYLTKWLRQNWINSLQKGYHTKQTVFSSIQKSGVSTVLLKGESYSAPPNMKKIMMLEHWRYQSNVQFLDASCLIYDFSGKLLEIVDYGHTHSSANAITHSGDIMDPEKKEGTHRIDIFLEKLPENVKELYFTMSGWAGVKIKEIRLPFVQLKDIETDMELCEYHFEGKNTGDHRCIVMCRMYRNEKSKAAQWQVEAIGHLGDGAADNYEPITKYIQGRFQKTQKS